ncbi:MAG: hypothetical protein Q8P18_19700 [Pseudomonadota bacterium]|nr:hypothetical protein [Pseudomonadota bacterium]
MRLFLVTSHLTGLLAGCSEYDLSSKHEDPKPEPSEDTGTPAEDTGTLPDTGETEDTDTVVVVDTGEVATEAVYINTSSTLFSYDPASGVSTRIGEFEEGSRPIDGGMTDIAIDLSGIMYGGSYSALYRVNPNTAECTFVANLDDEMTGLTFVSDGRLVGAGSAVSFVDTRTGALTPLVREGEYNTSGDIVGLPDGMLYWTVTGGDSLVQVDPNTGTARRRGTIGVTSIFGLGYAYGELLGFTSAGRVLVMDASNGRPSENDALSGTWWGATTNPVLW